MQQNQATARKTRRQSSASLQKLTSLGLLSAVIIVTAFVPLKTFGLEITLCMVPIAVGAAVFGPGTGAVLGGIFGIVSFLQCFGYSTFGVVLMGVQPLLTFLVCVPTRMAAGFLAGLIGSAIRKAAGKSGVLKEISLAVTALLTPVFNTLFFMTALCVCFYRTDYIQSFVSALGAANPFTFAVLFVGINGLVEIAAGFIIAYPVEKALIKVLKIK